MRADLPPADLDRAMNVAPLWQVRRTVEPRRLSKDYDCDVAVIGAGVAGLSAAQALSDSHKVIVVDAAMIAEGSTGWCAGILSASTTIDLDVVEGMFGHEMTRSLLFYFTDAITQMKQTVDLGSDWQAGKSVYIEARKGHRKLLERELDSRRRFGMGATFLGQPDVLKPWPPVNAALELSDEHACHPVKAMLSLAARIEESQGHVFEGTRALAWAQDDEGVTIECDGGTIRANHLIVCAGMGANSLDGTSDLSRWLVPVTSHVLVTEPSEAIARMVTDTQRIALWDTLELYHYVRYLPGGRVLVGGADEAGYTPPTKLPASHPQIAGLREWVDKVHKVKLPATEFAWKASLGVPSDGLPKMKVRAKGDSIVIAAVTDGLPSAFLMGNVAASLVRQGEHPLAKFLSSARPSPLPARMLAMLPSQSGITKAVHRAAFGLLKLKDALPL